MLSMKYVNIYFEINSNIFLYSRDEMFIFGRYSWKSHKMEVVTDLFLLWCDIWCNWLSKNLGKGLASKMDTSLQLIVILKNRITFSLNVSFNEYLKV